MAFLIVHSWHTECSCGYGSGGWASSPALEGKPVLGPNMIGQTCPGCGEVFTDIDDDNPFITQRPDL